jgi:hypothetical protein
MRSITTVSLLILLCFSFIFADQLDVADGDLNSVGNDTISIIVDGETLTKVLSDNVDDVKIVVVSIANSLNEMGILYHNLIGKNLITANEILRLNDSINIHLTTLATNFKTIDSLLTENRLLKKTIDDNSDIVDKIDDIQSPSLVKLGFGVDIEGLIIDKVTGRGISANAIMSVGQLFGKLNIGALSAGTGDLGLKGSVGVGFFIR